MAPRARPGPLVGAVLASRLVSPEVEELYDYDVVRSLSEPTMFVVRLGEPTLVLGASQSVKILDRNKVGSLALRRRRGGGGLVLLQPDDLRGLAHVDARGVRRDRARDRDVAGARRAGHACARRGEHARGRTRG